MYAPLTIPCRPLNVRLGQYTAVLSEEHRTLVVDKQNSRLALGKAVNKDGRTLPKATNMIKLVSVRAICSRP